MSEVCGLLEMPLRSPCDGRSRAVLAWLPAAAVTAETVAELHRERSWKNQRWKTLEEPAMQDDGIPRDELA